MLAIICMLMFMAVCTRWLWSAMNTWMKLLWVVSCLVVLVSMLILNKLL